ncbi:NUDIX domain-containing protein [Tumebacillus sp. ITR2]|uniref:NUDIX domain-containing protein n=1 Tax=Tumebacillus amylolyticus TaxID=2801339 RepID=A0ABS1JBF1_9BACL|nr:NUDIX domain-containing protein [Tumebacillus amylolyticus]MBL0387581.1 NUDIX domain-containing protein [Tumebacillus amylolyticus]
MSKWFTMPVAVHLFFVRDGEILLLRRFNTGYEDGNYSVPAGHLDGGEEVISAAIREAHEECGVVIKPADVQVVGVMHRRANDERVDFYVSVSVWSGEVVNTEPDKCDDLSWFGLDELPDNMIPYVRKAIENYHAGVWFDSYGWQPGE